MCGWKRLADTYPLVDRADGIQRTYGCTRRAYLPSNYTLLHIEVYRASSGEREVWQQADTEEYSDPWLAFLLRYGRDKHGNRLVQCPVCPDFVGSVFKLASHERTQDHKDGVAWAALETAGYQRIVVTEGHARELLFFAGTGILRFVGDETFAPGWARRLFAWADGEDSVEEDGETREARYALVRRLCALGENDPETKRKLVELALRGERQ
jgi:hypothetical protein